MSKAHQSRARTLKKKQLELARQEKKAKQNAIVTEE